MSEQVGEIWAGDSFTLEVTVKDAAGSVIDLTNSAAVASLADARGGAVAHLASNGSGVVVTDATNGKLEARFAPEHTAALVNGRRGALAQIQVRVFDALGRVSTVFDGRLMVWPSITGSL